MNDQSGIFQQPVVQPSNGIPAEKLSALLKASDEMGQSVFRLKRKDTLKAVARHVHDLLDAESCAIFLVTEDSPEYLTLAVEYSDKELLDAAEVRLKIQSVLGKGLTGHIAKEGKITSLHHAELANHPYATGHSPQHLASGQCLSLLAIPLKNRKGHLLGLVKVENKKDAQGVTSGATFFDKADESIAGILANKITMVLEGLRTFETFRTLLELMRSVGSLDEFLEKTLNIGMRLLEADRGHFVWWDVAGRRATIRALVGESNLKIGEVSPGWGVVHEVMDTRKPHLIRDVAAYKEAGNKYYPANPSTQSEVTVCLEFEGRVIGVLNMESSQMNGFDEQDQEVLQLLAHHAAIAAQVIGKEIYVRSIVQRLAEQSPSQEDVLKSILESVESCFGFDAGLIYIPDYARGLLLCSAWNGCDDTKANPAEFSYQFDEIALATKVFREKTEYISIDPVHDPIVNQKGIELFQIKGALVGIPLIFSGRAVGVLVIWSRRNLQPDQKHLDLLNPFTRLAAMTIAITESRQQRILVLKRVEEILIQMQTESLLEKNLHQILLGVQTAGFDKVRVFKFEEDAQSFVGIDSIGMDDPGKFTGLRIPLDKNPYAKKTVETWQKNPLAHEYKGDSLVPDPNANELEKDPTLPWAVVPVIIAGKLYGQIAADNKLTKREITRDSLEYLTLFGALAALAVAQNKLKELGYRKFREFFLRAALHRFNDPVHSVLNIAEELADEPSFTESKDLVQLLNGQANHLKRLTEQARTYMRLQSPTRPRSFVSLPQMIRNVVEEFDFDEITSSRIKSSLPNGDFGLVADEDALKYVMRNLLDNALKFSPPDTTINVTLTVEPNHFRVSVTDQGSGVPASERESIFEEFTSIARNDVPQSSGLGLPIAKFAITEHQGKIDYEDGPGGCGASFWFTLPRQGKIPLQH